MLHLVLPFFLSLFVLYPFSSFANPGASLHTVRTSYVFENSKAGGEAKALLQDLKEKINSCASVLEKSAKKAESEFKSLSLLTGAVKEEKMVRIESLKNRLLTLQQVYDEKINLANTVIFSQFKVYVDKALESVLSNESDTIVMLNDNVAFIKDSGKTVFNSSKGFDTSVSSQNIDISDKVLKQLETLNTKISIDLSVIDCSDKLYDAVLNYSDEQFVNFLTNQK